jgi:PAS domain-containing protein
MLASPLLSQILDALPTGIVVVDTDGLPIFTNRRAVELLGAAIASARGGGLLGGVHPINLAGTDTPYPRDRLPLWRALRGERAIVWDAEIRHPKGTTPVIMEAAPLRTDRNGVVLAAVVILDPLPVRAAA